MKLFSLISLILLCLLPFQAVAADSSIAVLDLDKILKESSAGKSIEKQLQERREAIQKEFSSRENNLVNIEKTLIQEKSSLTPEAFEVKRQDFEKQYTETRNLFQKRRNALDKGLSAALDQLRNEVTTITEEIAQQEGYEVVLTRENIVIISKEMDITDKVLKRMNEAVSNITLQVTE